MIEHFDIPQGNIKVVSQDKVEELSRAGWRLVAIVETMMTGSVSSNEYSGGQTITRYGPPTVMTTVQYVMHLDPQSSLALAAAERDEARVKAADEATKRAQAEKYAAAEKETACKAEMSVGTLKKHIDEHQIKAEDERKLRQRLETDLAKIRKAIGDLRFKEVVES